MSAPVSVLETARIASDDPALGLSLHRKRPTAAPAGGAVVLMHGASFSSASLFDVTLPAGSFADGLAARGLDVWMVDARGYGSSDRPAAMNRDPAGEPPLTRTGDAVADLARAVAHVRAETGRERVSVLGMSWGGSVAGAFAAGAPERVARLALIAPVWLATGPVRIDDGAPIGAWRAVDIAAYRERWLEQAPIHERSGLIEPGVFERWAERTLATDPACAGTGTIRAPAGAVADIREFWSRDHALYDPGRITCPVLLLHAAWDADVTLDRMSALFPRFTGASIRRWVEIAAGTHMVILERERARVLREVGDFLVGPP